MIGFGGGVECCCAGGVGGVGVGVGGGGRVQLNPSLKSNLRRHSPRLIIPPPDACTPPSANRHRHRTPLFRQFRICKIFPSAPNSDAAFGRLHRRARPRSASPQIIRRSELRLLAHFSRDPLLVEAYRRGDDIHTLTASQVFGVPPLMVTPDHRRQAKVVQLRASSYGLSPFGLSQQLGIEPAEAKLFIANYFEKYKGVRAFIDKTLEEARRDLKVKNPPRRIRPSPTSTAKNANQRGFAERTAVNTPLQGTAQT